MAALKVHAGLHHLLRALVVLVLACQGVGGARTRWVGARTQPAGRGVVEGILHPVDGSVGPDARHLQAAQPAR